MDMDSETWKQEFVHVGILQKNTWDCGMFMLKYIDFYSRGLGLMFDQVSICLTCYVHENNYLFELSSYITQLPSL